MLLAAAIQPRATIRLKPTIAVPRATPQRRSRVQSPMAARSATAPMVQKRVCWATAPKTTAMAKLSPRTRDVVPGSSASVTDDPHLQRARLYAEPLGVAVGPPRGLPTLWEGSRDSANGRPQGVRRSPGWPPGQAAQRGGRPFAEITRRAGAARGAGRRCAACPGVQPGPRDAPCPAPRATPARAFP